jgi:hypothetical protein
VTRERRIPAWPAPLIAALGLAALYAGALRTGFFSDDYIFLEEARTRPLLESLARMGDLGEFYRPLSRQLYFAALTPIAGGAPWVFHAANGALFLAALALLVDLLLALGPLGGAMAGALYFAVLPLQRVALGWVSCSQDLLALVAVLAALALHRRGRRAWAALAALAAIASKEVALPLPLALAAWDRFIGGRRAGQALARAWPAAAVFAAWGLMRLALGGFDSQADTLLRFGPDQFLAGYLHGAQSLLGLDHPAGMLRGLIARGPAPLPLALLAVLALWVPAPRAGSPPARETPGAAPGHPPPRAVAAFAGAWILMFGFVTGPVAHEWSSYFYALAAVGAAALVALLCRGIDRWLWLALVAVLLWWHAGSTGARAFAVAYRPWVWTSHLTSFYVERAAALSDTLARELKALEPAPPRGTRFFFATLPPWAGFQMGNGALVRSLYRDPTLGSHFYSQYSETTAAERPVRFLYWDGARLQRLYERAPDPLFQVGTDLLLLDRPAGAAHAFRRGLAAGGNPLDHLYWLGWAELWRGDRDAAEGAWRAWGAADDSALWFRQLRGARTALVEARDSIETRRLLMGAIRNGIGRPEAHAVLAQLLEAERPKYAALETKVATWLKPADRLARRELVRELIGARLDDRARVELEALERGDPGARSDPRLAEAIRALERRAPAPPWVVEF